jgi:hypothetical protein
MLQVALAQMIPVVSLQGPDGFNSNPVVAAAAFVAPSSPLFPSPSFTT